MKLLRAGIVSFFLLLTGLTALAQTITGSVVDAQTNEPLPFVNVFISNTTKGTQTDVKGAFVLKVQTAGYAKVVASMVGYKTVEQEFVLRPDETRRLAIRLSVDTKFLNEVKISGKRDRQWKRLYKDFEREFLGRSKNARNSAVKNPYDVDVIRKRGTLTANAAKSIEIDNKALGYHLSYQLEGFESSGEAYQFSGQLLFKPMPPANETEARTWERNRNETYRGSLRHFLAAVVQKKSRQEGFRVYLEEAPAEKLRRSRYFKNNSLIEINVDTLAKFNAALQRVTIRGQRYEIHYLHRSDPQNWYFDLNEEVSWLEIKSDFLAFSYNGIVENSRQLETIGSMSKRRVADLLPEDFLPTDTAPSDRVEDSGVIPHYQKQEKIILTTDRDAYIPGDTVHFQLQVMDATSYAPSAQSLVYLTIRTPQQWIEQQKIWVARGSYRGRWVIPDSLKGTYQLIAHNQWARNFDERFWARKNIRIITDSGPVSAASDTVQLRFFPESGTLLAGVPNRVGISSFTVEGHPVSVQGWLITAKGDTLCGFKSNDRGYGDFFMTPPADETVKAVFGHNRVQEFLKASPKGFIMQTDALRDSVVSVRLINTLRPAEWKPLRFIVHLRGQLLFEALITPKSPITFIKIPREDLEGTGVMQLLLLDALNQPIASRAFYQPAEEEQTVFSPHLFEAELYGCRLDSGIWSGTPLSLKSLDLLLLTHPIRSYHSATPDAFKYESGISLKGQITQPSGKPISGVSVLGLVNADSTRLSFDIKTNEAGRYVTPPLQFFGNADVVIQVQSDKAARTVINPDTLPEYVPQWLWFPTASTTEKQMQQLINQWRNTNTSDIQSASNGPRRDFRRNYASASETILINDRLMDGQSFLQILVKKGKNIKVDNDGAYFADMGNSKANGKRTALFIDGLSTNWESVQTLKWINIEAIDLLKEPSAVKALGSEPTNGAINVLLKPESTFLSSQNIKRIIVRGFER
ncbi:hypothetical protein Runsl_2820 [Runella slithyformis DSM 19594]|uniref:Carboxypeptidase-like regulatory domain-containing protein n=2 Tax=Runella TaxID=105 RepID=A0A7U3ZL41_RUNSL|nr:hypothetical protein Runsl_2820 [Runella slithyformis DSM 19594]